MIEAWIGLGSNLGDRSATLDAALERIDRLERSSVVRVSRYYRTTPWGETDQPDFVNAVACVRTALSAQALLRALLAIESEMGRERRGRRWGPRVIDLDLLLYGDDRVERPDLTVPHPRLHERAFVLVPLAELAPDRVVPGRGRVDALLGALTDNERSGVRSGPERGFQSSPDERSPNEWETR